MQIGFSIYIVEYLKLEVCLRIFFSFLLLFQTRRVSFLPPEKKGKQSFVDTSKQYLHKWCKLGIYKSRKEIKDQAPYQ